MRGMRWPSRWDWVDYLLQFGGTLFVFIIDWRRWRVFCQDGKRSWTEWSSNSCVIQLGIEGNSLSLSSAVQNDVLTKGSSTQLVSTWRSESSRDLFCEKSAQFVMLAGAQNKSSTTPATTSTCCKVAKHQLLLQRFEGSLDIAEHWTSFFSWKFKFLSFSTKKEIHSMKQNRMWHYDHTQAQCRQWGMSSAWRNLADCLPQSDRFCFLTWEAGNKCSLLGLLTTHRYRLLIMKLQENISTWDESVWWQEGAEAPRMCLWFLTQSAMMEERQISCWMHLHSTKQQRAHLPSTRVMDVSPISDPALLVLLLAVMTVFLLCSSVWTATTAHRARQLSLWIHSI